MLVNLFVYIYECVFIYFYNIYILFIYVIIYLFIYIYINHIILYAHTDYHGISSFMSPFHPPCHKFGLLCTQRSSSTSAASTPAERRGDKDEALVPMASQGVDLRTLEIYRFKRDGLT